MAIIRKLIRAEFNQLGDDEVEVVMSTAALARDGHILLPQGCRIDNYRANPIVLWSHDPDCPVGNAETTSIEADRITARVRFAPIGISHKADEIRGLTKAGVIRAVSVGFDPLEGEPLDPKKPRGGQRFTDWELLELSFVSVPADIGAVVTNRSQGDEGMAEVAAADDPGAQVIEGDAVVVEEPVRAATKPGKRRAMRAQKKVAFSRGIYQIAQLLYLFDELDWQVDMAEYEAIIEDDQSQVPAMLAGVLQDLADAIIAMTAEEIAEALAGHDIEVEGEPDDDDLDAGERAHIAAAATPALREFRRGLARAKLRAGKTLSEETVRCLREAKALHEEAMDLHRSAMRKHKDGLATIDDMMDRAGVSDPDSDTTQTVQTSSGTGVDEGSEGQRMSAEYRRRQADLLALSA